MEPFISHPSIQCYTTAAFPQDLSEQRGTSRPRPTTDFRTVDDDSGSHHYHRTACISGLPFLIIVDQGDDREL